MLEIKTHEKEPLGCIKDLSLESNCKVRVVFNVVHTCLARDKTWRIGKYICSATDILYIWELNQPPTPPQLFSFYLRRSRPIKKTNKTTVIHEIHETTRISMESNKMKTVIQMTNFIIAI